MRSQEIIEIDRSGLSDFAGDRNRPGACPETFRVAPRVTLVCSEFVEIVVAGHVLERGGLFVGSEGGGISTSCWGGRRGLALGATGERRRERCPRCRPRGTEKELPPTQKEIVTRNLAGLDDVGASDQQRTPCFSQLTSHLRRSASSVGSARGSCLRDWEEPRLPNGYRSRAPARFWSCQRCGNAEVPGAQIRRRMRARSEARRNSRPLRVARSNAAGRRVDRSLGRR